MRKWLKYARNQSDLTQKEMADMLGISEAYYSFIEAGKRKKRLDTTFCMKLSKIFCLPVERIVELEEEDGT